MFLSSFKIRLPITKIIDNNTFEGKLINLSKYCLKTI